MELAKIITTKTAEPEAEATEAKCFESECIELLREIKDCVCAIHKAVETVPPTGETVTSEAETPDVISFNERR